MLYRKLYCTLRMPRPNRAHRFWVAAACSSCQAACAAAAACSRCSLTPQPLLPKDSTVRK